MEHIPNQAKNFVRYILFVKLDVHHVIRLEIANTNSKNSLP